MSTSIQFRDLRADADASFIEDIYREILQPSFSPDELDPLEVILDGLTEGGSYELWGLSAMDGDMPVGCMLVYPYRESGVLLIGYLAVKQGARSRGIGGLLADEGATALVRAAGLSVGSWRRLKIRVITPRRVTSTRSGAWPSTRGAGRRSSLARTSSRASTKCRQRVYDFFLTVHHRGDAVISPESTISARRVADFLQEYFAASGEGSDWPQDDEGRWLLDWYRSREMVNLQPIGELREGRRSAIPIPQRRLRTRPHDRKRVRPARRGSSRAA